MENKDLNKPPVAQFIALIVITGAMILAAKAFGNNPEVASSPTPQPSASASTNQTEGKTMAKIETTKGTITVELFSKDAPKTVENFEKLAQKNYYNGIIFHRVIKEFVIQAGDPTGTGSGGESAFGGEFKDEINSHKLVPGALAMANRGPDTNTSQFFIVTEKDQPTLDGRYTVFGQVTDGMDVVHAIAAVPTDKKNDKPLEDVKITSVVIEEK